MLTVRSAFHHEPRARLTKQQVAKLFFERGGACRQCDRTLGASDDWIVEHVLALENGGTNDWGNLALTCGWCKPAKDASDHSIAAKSRHVASKHVVSRSMRLSSSRKAPMPGSRASGFKKRMDGTVERRR